MRSKKVAYVATVYAHLAAFHLPFMKDLQAQGFDVHAYASPDHRKEALIANGLECRDITFSRNPLAFGNIQAIRALTERFKAEDYDLIHVHTPNASVVCRIAAWLAGSRQVVYTAHGFHFFRGASRANWLLYYPIERLMARFTDVLVTINKEDYDRALKFPVRGESAYIPGIGVELAPFRTNLAERSRKLRAELELSEETLIVLCVAEMNRNKNQGQLLRSIRKLTDAGIPVVGVFAGTGDAEEAYKQLARELHIEPQTRFLGFRKDAADLICLADILALMSHREGLPKVLLEGLAAGKPMVVTQVRGNRDLVSDGDNGYVVPVGDVDATVAAIQDLYRNPERRDQMGRSSYRQADGYSLDVIKEKLHAIHAKVIDRKG
ncbi:glycosyltransferase family 4 protein [Paenibacillus glycinis]|uniref:Glycosyltransferase n=1 Tax=Paenibacillus glycinis TaxID=2697035 RepID=A0ABW9XNQ4_9BACL|nr:glycosyltransferase family 4 protein [Paenibacillus glycinis]NBD24201.1 glycosyltransferase [Paenibacillus glycinis]